MKRFLLLATLFVTIISGLYADIVETTSPDGNVIVKFELTDNGEPTYAVSYKEKDVIIDSKMGFDLTDGTDMKQNFSLVSVTEDKFDDIWEPVWGEVKTITNSYNEMVVSLEKNDTKKKFRIRFRVYNDGVGFRYEFKNQPEQTYFQIAEEQTEFNLTGNHKAFWIPCNFDSQEYNYTTSLLSEIKATSADGNGVGTHRILRDDAVQSPLMMKTDEGLYINIFEAALSNYPAMHLIVNRDENQLTSLLAPNALGTKAYMQTPCRTPWRTIIVSDDARDILASKTILNLNDTCKISDISFIKPQKYIGIWWEMHVPNKSSWNYADQGNIKLQKTNWNILNPNGRHGANTANAIKYIDFAAENGFGSVLIEGWNVGWEDWAGNWKEDVFDFVTPYPDFDLDSISRYAEEKGVKIIMHHETSGSVTNYERHIDKAIDLMREYGYDAVKTGYVGWIIPRGETHDGQWMVNHYNRTIAKFAENKMMIVEHEPVRPTGMHRTYPNLMACEAARGNEYNAWSNGNNPDHETILPFTRLMGGPMDYTPGIFEIKMNHYQEGNPCQVHTTLAKQLALYVTMYSPIQMAADLPENYEKYSDAFQFIKDVAVDWDDTKILEAEPGDYITIARKEKNSDNWFIGAITDENSRTTEIDLSFLDKDKKYEATIYADGKNADWEENPICYQISTKKVTSKTKLKIKLANGGGAAVSLRLRP